jgi:hypothetical protein
MSNNSQIPEAVDDAELPLSTVEVPQATVSGVIFSPVDFPQATLSGNFSFFNNIAPLPTDFSNATVTVYTDNASELNLEGANGVVVLPSSAAPPPGSPISGNFTFFEPSNEDDNDEEHAMGYYHLSSAARGG